jgi:hypothetical protein
VSLRDYDGDTARRWLSTSGAELQTILAPILAELSSNGLFEAALGNESDGDPVVVFKIDPSREPTVEAARAAIMGDTPHWARSALQSGSEENLRVGAPEDSDQHPEAFFRVVEALDEAEVAEAWVGETVEDDEDYGCSEEDARSMRAAVRLLNEAAGGAGGTCFEFAHPCRRQRADNSSDGSTYTGGVGCICADGALVGWRQDNIVWT